MPPNIERFNQTAASIFSLLYSTFPLRQSLHATTLTGIDVTIGPDGRMSNSDDQLTTLLAAADTIRWLSDEGFIMAVRSHTTSLDFQGCTLTLRGLEILNAIPSTVNGSKTRGELLTEQVEKSLLAEAGNMVSKMLAKAVEATAAGVTRGIVA